MESTGARGNYYRGAKVGQWTYFNSNGVIDSTRTYPKPKVENDSTFLLYFEDGRIHIKGQIINNLKEGMWEEYDQKGQVVNEVFYHRDKYSGTTWRSKSYSMDYKESLRDGFVKSYNKDGNLRSLEEYQKDIKNGQHITYYRSNQIKSIGKYKNGYAIGIHNKYDSDGQLLESKIYDNRGSLVSFKKYTSGRLTIEGRYLNGYKSGHWKHYYGSDDYESKYYPEDLESLMGSNTPNNKETIVEKYNPEIHSIRSQ